MTELLFADGKMDTMKMDLSNLPKAAGQSKPGLVTSKLNFATTLHFSRHIPWIICSRRSARNERNLWSSMPGKYSRFSSTLWNVSEHTDRLKALKSPAASKSV